MVLRVQIESAQINLGTDLALIGLDALAMFFMGSFEQEWVEEKRGENLKVPLCKGGFRGIF